MINNKFLFSSFISVADTSALHVICFFIKINKILNDFYNVVRSKELGSSSFKRSKELDSVIFLIFSFIFSYVFFSVIILVNSS